MKYANLIYTDFCRNSAKRNNLVPIDMGYGDPASEKFIPKKLLSYLIEKLKLKNAGAYPQIEGDIELIEKIKEYLIIDEKVEYTYQIAIVTGGGRSALTNILASILSQNDVILIPYPAWSGYKSIAKFLKINIVPIETSIENNFIPTVKQIEDSILIAKKEFPLSKVGIMILNMPHNPTNTVYSTDSIKEIIKLLNTHKIICLADYTYKAIRDTNVFVPSVHKIAEEMEYLMQLPRHTLTDNIIAMQTFGKVTLTPGFRLGYVSTTNHQLIDRFCEKKQATDFGGNIFMQKAFAAYLNSKEQKDEFNQNNISFEKRRNAFLSNLQKYDYTPKNKNVILNNVGFYISFRVPRKYKELKITDFDYLLKEYSFIKESVNIDDYKSIFQDKGWIPSSEIFVLELIKKCAINVLPGHLFSSKNKGEYENWVRVALIQDEETIKGAFKRITEDILKW